MPADNPVSWFVLMCLGLFFIFRFIRRVIIEDARRKAERERACQEFFLETPLDKRNILMYNSYIKERDYYELHDDRL